ncbi:hypothetical protein H1P_4470003 [Hyella patelloides LEGE 07179]|uniref:Uncharacterized protein n=1 Tax=Hyella patelloides LEGE 07179 TaxID=945734 RepID=A0A563VYC1_9CYAN|nr:hypothetical protein H1P_4470003 [Hyella patelloides LEGE 07179]
MHFILGHEVSGNFNYRVGWATEGSPKGYTFGYTLVQCPPYYNFLSLLVMQTAVTQVAS